MADSEKAEELFAEFSGAFGSPWRAVGTSLGSVIYKNGFLIAEQTQLIRQRVVVKTKTMHFSCSIPGQRQSKIVALQKN